MFCENCGAEIKDDSLFCESCGAPVSEGETLPKAEAATEQETPKPKSKKLAIVLIVALLVAVVAAIAIFLILPAVNGNSTEDDANSTSSYQTEEPTDTSKTDGSSSSTKSDAPKNTSPSGGITESKDVKRPDEMGALTNASLRWSINLFLSNFTEVGLNNMSNSSSADSAQLVSFAVNHDAINARDKFEDVTGSSTYSKKISVDRVSYISKLFIGVAPNYSSLPSGYSQKDGYLYVSTSALSSSSQGIACVTGSENLGGNQVRYYFNVYKGNYNPTDSSIYSKTEDEIKSMLGATTPEYGGVAIVTTGGSSEVTDGMTLKSIVKTS